MDFEYVVMGLIGWVMLYGLQFLHPETDDEQETDGEGLQGRKDD